MDRIQDNVEVETNGAISRPVTETSRITGVRRTELVEPGYGGLGYRTDTGSIDWQAVFASVCCGLAITAMLTLLGVAVGLISGTENTDGSDAAGILGAVGAWTVVAMCIGAFVGSVLGGRLARWLDRGSIGYHTLTSWGLATLMTIALAALVSIGFANGTNAAANGAEATDVTTPATADPNATPQPGATDGSEQGQTAKDANSTSAAENADKTANALGGAGAGIAISMILTLIASGAGWWIGSRKRLLDIEREPVDTTVAV
jgi:hypothetical protein